MTDVFYWILNISILGGIIGCILMLLRSIKTIPKFAVYSLWSVVLIRLIMPFGVASKYSLLSLISRITSKTVVVDSIVNPNLTMSNFVMAADSYFPAVYKTDTLEKIFGVASVIWLVIAVFLVLIIMVLYFLSMNGIKNSVHIRDNIYYSNKVRNASVYGILHPKILIPDNIAEDRLRYILLHEQVHIKRLDNLWRIVALVAASVHWFNPLIHVFIHSFFSDMELSCDVKAVKDLSLEERKEYARTLLEHSIVHKSFVIPAFGGSIIKARVENILSYKVLSAISSIFFSIFIIIIIITLLTNSVV